MAVQQLINEETDGVLDSTLCGIITVASVSTSGKQTLGESLLLSCMKLH